MKTKIKGFKGLKRMGGIKRLGGLKASPQRLTNLKRRPRLSIFKKEI